MLKCAPKANERKRVQSRAKAREPLLGTRQCPGQHPVRFRSVPTPLTRTPVAVDLRTHSTVNAAVKIMFILSRTMSYTSMKLRSAGAVAFGDGGERSGILNCRGQAQRVRGHVSRAYTYWPTRLASTPSPTPTTALRTTVAVPHYCTVHYSTRVHIYLLTSSSES